MAGCNCNKETYLTSYQDVTETVKAQHADWSAPQIRRETAKIFRPQYRQNAESRKRELLGEKEYDGTDFTYTPGEGVRFNYGEGSMGLLEFHERQLSLTPEAYSEEQHQTSLLIDQAFRGGATKVATSYSEPGGQRDIVLMTLDRTTGKGKMRIINTVKDHTMPEMQNLVKKTFSHLSEVRPTANVFIVSDTHLSKEQIQQKFTTPDRQVHTVIKEAVGAAKNTFREILYTTDSVRKFVKRSQDERLKIHTEVIGESFVHRVRRMFEHKTDAKEGSIVIVPPKERIQSVEKKKVKKQEGNFIERSMEKMNQTRQQVREKIAASIATLLFVRVTGVGIGGAFESLNSIVQISKISLESVKRSGREKLKRRKRTLGKMRVLRMSETFKKLPKKEQHVLRQKEKAFRTQEKILLQRKERRSMRRKEKLLRRKEKKLLFRKERRSIRSKEKQVWKVLRWLVKKEFIILRKSVEQKSLVKKNQQKEMLRKRPVGESVVKSAMTRIEGHTKWQEKQQVIDFSVALVIWLIMHMQSTSRHQEEKRHDVSVIKREKSKKFIVKESAQWLLFAIIWHLAMIREGGMRTVYKQKKAKKQIKQYYPTPIPQQGVIFAFAS